MNWLNNLICCITTIIFIGCNYTSISDVNIKQNEIDSSRYFEGYETGDFYITPELTKEGLEYEMAMMLLTGAGLGQVDVLYLFGEEPPSYNSYARFLPYTMVMIDRYNKPEFYENLYYQAELYLSNNNLQDLIIKYFKEGDSLGVKTASKYLHKIYDNSKRIKGYSSDNIALNDMLYLDSLRINIIANGDSNSCIPLYDHYKSINQTREMAVYYMILADKYNLSSAYFDVYNILINDTIKYPQSKDIALEYLRKGYRKGIKKCEEEMTKYSK